MKNKQKGFIVPLLILIIAVVVIGGVVYFQSTSPKASDDSSLNSTATSSSDTTLTPGFETDTGIVGTVIVAPTCAGPVTNSEPCVKPYATTFDLTNKESGSVRQFDSNSEGAFKVIAPSGEYEIKESNPKTLPTMTPVTVTVSPHSFTKVSLQFDSGIR